MRKIVARSRCNSFDSVGSNMSNVSLPEDSVAYFNEKYEKIVARSRCNSFDSVGSNMSNASLPEDNVAYFNEKYEKLKKKYNRLEKRHNRLEKRYNRLEKRQNIINTKLNTHIKKEKKENIEKEVKELMRCMLNDVEYKIERDELEAAGWTHSGRLDCVIS